MDWHFINLSPNAITSEFYVDLWIGSTLVAHYPFSSLVGHGSTGFDDWLVTVPDVGWKRVRLVIDSENAIAEGDETNNAWEKFFYWDEFVPTATPTMTLTPTATREPKPTRTRTVTPTFTPTATATRVPRACASLAGVVFADANGNRVRDPNESTMPNVSIRVQDKANARTWNKQTNTRGKYKFRNLPDGTKIASIVLPDGYTNTTKARVKFSVPPCKVINFGIRATFITPSENPSPTTTASTNEANPIKPIRLNGAAPTQAQARALAFDPTRKILVYTNGTGLVRRAADGTETRISLDGDLRALAIDSARGEIWASDARNGRVRVWDEMTLAERARVDGLSQPNGIALSEERAYVADTRANELLIFDLSTHSILQRVPLAAAPYAVAFNAGNERVYVGQAASDRISVLDADGARLATISLGGLGLVQGIAVNTRTNRVYAVYFRGPRFHAVAEIDGSTNQVLARIGGDYAHPFSRAYGITVDETRNRIFVNDNVGLAEIDGGTRGITTLPEGGITRGDYFSGYAFGMVYDGAAQVVVGGVNTFPVQTHPVRE